MRFKIFLFLLSISPCLYGQQAWQLMSTEGDPVSFAKITVLNSEDWFSSDQNGKFSLNLTQYGKNEIFNISATGYLEGTFSWNDLKKDTVLYLNTQYFDLEEVVVLSNSLKSYTIGNRSLPISISRNKREKRKAGIMRYASFFEMKGNETKLLSGLSLYLSENGDKNIEFTLRVMVSDKVRNLKKGKIYQVAEFQDLYNKPLLCRLENYGWTKIDLEDKEIVIPGRYKAIFLIFDLVKPKNKKTELSMVIPFQRESNENQYPGFYFPGGAIGIFDTKKEHFAVVLNYLSE